MPFRAASIRPSNRRAHPRLLGGPSGKPRRRACQYRSGLLRARGFGGGGVGLPAPGNGKEEACCEQHDTSCSVSVCALALAPSAALAQITTSTVIGTVKDAQGGVIPGATVTLISDTRGLQAAEVTTDSTGVYVIPNVTPDTYTVQVTLQGFKTLRTSGIIVSSGDRLSLPAYVLDVGTLSETVQVTGETPLIQASSGERSFTVPTASVENLPISSRNFRDLALLTPGVRSDGSMAGVGRIGGGGYANIQMDGISAMDTGNNGQMIAMNVEAVAEVKVLTTAYQAEYGRSSGIQILSVTRGGTNQFRGSVYDIERHSDWNTNSKANKLNGINKSVSDQRDWGYSIGGPIGKPGGNNKLFFFYSHEYRPRTSASNRETFRVPTMLERQGDFSQSRDNQGNLYPYIKDYTLGLTCSATNTAGCFKDGGVLGKIPQSRQYAPGMALLNAIPLMPNYDQQYPYGYNVEQYPDKRKTLSYQPAVRVDYQVMSSLRVAFKFNGHNTNSGTPATVRRDRFRIRHCDPRLVRLSGQPEALGDHDVGVGQLQHRVEDVHRGPLGEDAELLRRGRHGGARRIGSTPGCRGFPTSTPPTGTSTPTTGWLRGAVRAWWRRSSSTARSSCRSRSGTARGRRARSATLRYPGWLNVNQTWDVAGSVTHVRGRHTLKAGLNINHSFKAQNMTQGVLPMGSISFSETTNNFYDSSFGYANAALGIFNNYSQASKFIESGIQYYGVEPFVQDNWKVSNRLTLDYGIRFVHLQPEHDKYMQAANFFTDQWSAADAPALYAAGLPGRGVSVSATRARR